MLKLHPIFVYDQISFRKVKETLKTCFQDLWIKQLFKPLLPGVH